MSKTAKPKEKPAKKNSMTNVASTTDVASAAIADGVVVPTKDATSAMGIIQTPVSKELKQWFKSCPNLEELQDCLWKSTKQRCHECGDRFPRFQLRADVISPYADGHLICTECWTIFFNFATTPKLAWDDQPMPSKDQATKAVCYDGILIDRKTRERRGTVQKYNPSTRSAVRVQLDAFPDCAESGMIDEEDEVIPNPASKKIIITQHDDDSEGTTTDDDDDDDEKHEKDEKDHHQRATDRAMSNIIRFMSEKSNRIVAPIHSVTTTSAAAATVAALAEPPVETSVKSKKRPLKPSSTMKPTQTKKVKRSVKKGSVTTTSSSHPPLENGRKMTILPTKKVVILDADTDEYKVEHQRWTDRLRRNIDGSPACDYRHHIPKIPERDKKKDGKYQCVGCLEPIAETIARHPVHVPTFDDTEPPRKQDADGKYYDVWKPSGYWIVHDGVPESFDPSHLHLLCFQSMDDNNFSLFM